MGQFFHESNFAFDGIHGRLVTHAAGLVIAFHGAHAFENGFMKNFDGHQMFGIRRRIIFGPHVVVALGGNGA